MDTTLDRRRAYEARLNRITDVDRRVEDLVNGGGSGGGLAAFDPDGVLTETLHALARLALSRPGFDLAVTLPRPDGRGFRIRNNGGELDLSVLAPDHEDHSDGAGSTDTENVVADLAALLRGSQPAR